MPTVTTYSIGHTFSFIIISIYINPLSSSPSSLSTSTIPRYIGSSAVFSNFFFNSHKLSLFYLPTMAPLLISYGQGNVGDYRKQMLVEEYLREHGHPTGGVTESPTVHAQDDAEVVLDTEVNNSSSDISLVVSSHSPGVR